MILFLYILNSTLLIIHEVESGYEEEWKIFNLPMEISGFLLIHFPFVIPMFYGAIELNKGSSLGNIFAIFWAVVGMMPFFAHKIFFNRKDKFNRVTSNIIIYLNLIVGLSLLIISIIK